MTRLFSCSFHAVALLSCVGPLHAALVVKPNVAPIVTNSLGNYQQYDQAIRVVDLTGFFRDPDASSAVP